MVSLPEKYRRLFDYASYQNANPTRPLPGIRVNLDLNDLERAVAEIIDALQFVVVNNDVSELENGASGFSLIANGVGVTPTWQGFTQVGVGAVERSWQDKLREIEFNVMDFGAACDGTSDDTPATLLAVAAARASSGGVVTFPVGTGSLGNIMNQVERTSGVSFRGQGPGVTILKLRSDSTSNAIFNIRHADNFSVEDLTLDGDSLDIDHNGLLTIYEATDVVVRNVEIKNFTYAGLSGNGIIGASIDGCLFKRATTSAAENYAALLSQDPINTSLSKNIRFSNNRVENSGTLFSVGGLNVSNNIFDGNGFGGAICTLAGDADSYACVIADNLIVGSTGVDENGVAPCGVEAGSSGAISGNIIHDMAGGGMSLFAYNAVTGNEIDNVGLSTPSLTGTTTTSVTVGTGVKTVTTQTAKAFLPTGGVAVNAAQSVTVYSAANATNQVSGPVTDYNSATGSLTFTATAMSGSGSFTDGVIVSSAKNGIAISALYLDATFNANGSIIGGNSLKGGLYSEYGYREWSASLANIQLGTNNFVGATVAPDLILAPTRTTLISTNGSFAVGDILAADTIKTFARIAGVATGNVLLSGGVSVAPSWGKIGLDTHTTGALPPARGGTGQDFSAAHGAICAVAGTMAATTVPAAFGGTGATSLTANGVLFGSGTSPVGVTAALTDGQLIVGQTSANPLPKTLSGDATLSAAGALTLASIISAGGPTGSATVAPIITYDAKGRLTAVSSATITPAVGSITGFGTGIATALGIAVGSAGAPILFNGAGGTPSSMTGTNITGIPTTGLTGTLQAAQEPAHTGDVTNSAGSLALTLATVNSNVGTFGSATQSVQFTVNAKGLITAAANATVTPAVGSITGLGTGVATFLGTPSSANLAAAVTDETGSGALVFGTSPTIATPVINGLPTGTGVASAATASTLVARTASGHVNSVALSTNVGAGTTAQLDGSSQTSWSVANGASLDIGAGTYMVFVSSADTGDIAIYLVGGTLNAMVYGVSGNWVASTTSPAAGKLSIAWDGVSTNRIYNNRGGTSTGKIFQIRIN